MHLGLKRDPLFAIVWCQAPVLRRSPSLPPDSNSSHNVHRKGAQNILVREAPCPEASICLAKSPGKRNPSMLPNGGTYGKSCLFPKLPFTFLSNSSISVLLIKVNFTLFFGGRRKGTFPPFSPQTGPLWKQAPSSRALLSISFGVRSEGTLPPSFPS